MGGLPLLLLLKLVAFGVYMEEDLRHPPVPQSYFSSSASRLAIAAAALSLKVSGLQSCEIPYLMSSSRFLGFQILSSSSLSGSFSSHRFGPC